MSPRVDHSRTLGDLTASLCERAPGFIGRIDERHGLSRIIGRSFGLMREFFLRPGGRLRPTLFLLSYRGCGGNESEGVFDAALAVELLHSFALAHDDIADRSAVRRSGPALHVMLGGGDSGSHRAMVAGDLMHTAALRAFVESGEDAALTLRAMIALLDCGVMTAAGALAELGAESPMAGMTETGVIELMEMKTGLYTFAAPLAAGAALAGADEGEVARLVALGRLAGAAYQIADDAADFADDLAWSARELVPLRPSLPSWRARESAVAEVRDVIDRLALGLGATEAQEAAVIESASTNGAIRYSLEAAALLSDRASQIARGLGMAEESRELIAELAAMASRRATSCAGGECAR